MKYPEIPHCLLPAVVSAAAICLAAIPLQAVTTIMAEDWSDYPNETFPSLPVTFSNGTYDAQVGTFSTSNDPEVRNNTGGLYPSSLINGNYLAIDNGNDAVSFNPTSTSEIMLETSYSFDFYMTDNVSMSPGEGLGINAFHTSTSGARFIFSSDNKIYERGDTIGVSSDAYSIDKWISATLTFSESEYHIFLDDGTNTDTISFSYAGADIDETTTLERVQFRQEISTSSSTDFAYGDNFVVLAGVPEPSTYALAMGVMTLVGMGIMRSRRKGR